EKLIKAKKRVERIRSFYKHLTVYLIINILILLLKIYFLGFFGGSGIQNQGFITWIEWNVIATPLLWGIGLAIHGIYVFSIKPDFLKKWEARKIQEYMENDQNDMENYR
ncbi:MAG: 2TM domain-containing protein, partial [Bacteroidota bacterium]